MPFVYRDNSNLKSYTNILAQPISYNTAREIFDQIRGRSAPPEWQGNLNFTYRLGPEMMSGRQLRLKINNKNVQKKIFDVFAEIPGDTEPDRYVIVGHQRDSLSLGAFKSASGTGVLLELARIFSKLYYEHGWRPRRTIMFASFSGEEFNLIGSSEWLQEMEKILSVRAVAYINVAKLVSGGDILKVIASPLLYDLIYSVTSQVQISPPESVYDKWLRSQPVFLDPKNSVLHLLEVEALLHSYYPEHTTFFEDPSEEESESLLRRYLHSASMTERPRVLNLDLEGSYSPFVTMSGIPVIDLQLIKNSDLNQNSSQENSRVYNFYPLEGTQYDRFDALKKFVDPEFAKHKIIATILSEFILQLSGSRFLPINLLNYAQRLNDFHQKSLQMHDVLLKDHFESLSQTQNFMMLMGKFKCYFYNYCLTLTLKFISTELLENSICNFTIAAIKMHAYQEKIDDLR